MVFLVLSGFHSTTQMNYKFLQHSWFMLSITFYWLSPLLTSSAQVWHPTLRPFSTSNDHPIYCVLHLIHRLLHNLNLLRNVSLQWRRIRCRRRSIQAFEACPQRPQVRQDISTFISTVLNPTRKYCIRSHARDAKPHQLSRKIEESQYVIIRSKLYTLRNEALSFLMRDQSLSLEVVLERDCLDVFLASA